MAVFHCPYTFEWKKGNNFQHGKYDKPCEGGSVKRLYDRFPTLMNDTCEFLSRVSFTSY